MEVSYLLTGGHDMLWAMVKRSYKSLVALKIELPRTLQFHTCLWLPLQTKFTSSVGHNVQWLMHLCLQGNVRKEDDSSHLLKSTMYMSQPAFVCIDDPREEYMNLKFSFCAAWANGTFASHSFTLTDVVTKGEWGDMAIMLRS